METQTSYRLCLKLRVGKALATEEPSLAASLAGYDVTISSEQHLQPLSEASWLLIECRGFVTEEDARGYGEALRRAAHLAGLCTRVGVDGGDPGENRTVSYVNPDALRSIGVLDPDARIAPDIHVLWSFQTTGRRCSFASGRRREYYSQTRTTSFALLRRHSRSLVRP